MMRNKDAFTLLYNNLWLVDREKLKSLNPNANSGINPGVDWEEYGRITQRNVAQAHNITTAQILKDPIISGELKDYLPKSLIPEVRIESPQQNVSSLKPEMIMNEGLTNTNTLIDNWDELVTLITACKKCSLCNTRTQVVIERGCRTAPWMFIGEAPGRDEDLQGLPFVGASGQLLNKMIAAMKLNFENDVYICNVVKCRPPQNRNPLDEEINACKNYLFSQIALVKPRIIITLGRYASQLLLNTTSAQGKLRGNVHQYGDIPVVVTYHPSYLLRNPAAKKDTWQDLQLAMEVIEKINAN